MLLDPEPTVRQAAAAVLEQVASPETISLVMLRRTLLIRNWVPEAEREAIDRHLHALDTAREAGSDAATIEAVTKALADGTEAFAAQRMNRGIAQALSGRKVESL